VISTGTFVFGIIGAFLIGVLVTAVITLKVFLHITKSPLNFVRGMAVHTPGKEAVLQVASELLEGGTHE
jgi:hypothetical protein